MFHLYGRSLHSDAEVFVRGDVRHTDSSIPHICRGYWFVLVQIEYARRTDWLDEGIVPLGLVLPVSIRATSSCVTGAVILLVWSRWRRKHIWGVFSHVLHQICFLQRERDAEKEMHIRLILKKNWECCSFMVRDWLLMFVPRYMCGCINHRSRVCRAWLCEWTDEPPGWLRRHNHGYSGDTYTACPCCADADETVKDWAKYTKVTIHPQKIIIYSHHVAPNLSKSELLVCKQWKWKGSKGCQAPNSIIKPS